MGKNIVLIGLMGAGKSSVGLALSNKLNKKLFDIDNLIECENGMKISEIFEKYGEKTFRKMERDIILKLSSLNDRIISTGGGSVENPENLSNLKKNGFLVYLKTSPEILYGRIKDQTGRPLLNTENPAEKLRELLIKREENYMKADLILDTTNKTIDTITEEIIKNYYENRKC